MTKPPPSYECDHCHREKKGRPALEMSTWIGSGRETETRAWDLCSECLLDLVAWIEGEEANGRTA